MRQLAALGGLTGVVGFLLGLVAAGTQPLHPTSQLPARPPSTVLSGLSLTPAASSPLPAVPTTPDGAVDFASVAARINGAIVNVDTASRGSEDIARYPRRYAPDDPAAPHEGSGSGFIIDPGGYILTNHHVVSGADRVTVTLTDGRVFRADVIGVDPAIDVALLHVQTREPLPAAPLGDSDGLRVGEWVCAIGNPLGVYVHSVTVGVVSFLGRKLFDPSLDAYIQTDAAISFGNSGGPLINARGQVVGITTAISIQAPNIGFAIPISQVIAVLPQLRDRGSVSRGYVGIGLTDVTPALRRALKIDPEHGALVQDVTWDTPADRAGLRPYDVVTSVDGHPIRSDEELIRYISGRMPGTVASLEIWRDGGMQTVQIKLKDRPLPEAVRSRSMAANDVRPVAQQDAPFGLSVRDLDATAIDRLKLPDTMQGMLVTEVDPAGPARLAQIRPNQVILEINRRRVASTAEYRAVVASLKPGEAVALLIFDRASGGRVICTLIPDPAR